jgi:hypothetical protein
MTKAELDEIKARATAATEPPTAVTSVVRYFDLLRSLGHTDVPALIAALEEAWAVLRQVEWTIVDPDSSYSDQWCLFCQVVWAEGKPRPPHASDCALAAVLR